MSDVGRASASPRSSPSQALLVPSSCRGRSSRSRILPSNNRVNSDQARAVPVPRDKSAGVRMVMPRPLISRQVGRRRRGSSSTMSLSLLRTRESWVRFRM